MEKAKGPIQSETYYIETSELRREDSVVTQAKKSSKALSKIGGFEKSRSSRDGFTEFSNCGSSTFKKPWYIFQEH
jgi:hypothetical protein